MLFRQKHHMAEVVGSREEEDVVAEGVGSPVRIPTDLRPTIQIHIIKEEPRPAWLWAVVFPRDPILPKADSKGKDLPRTKFKSPRTTGHAIYAVWLSVAGPTTTGIVDTLVGGATYVAASAITVADARPSSVADVARMELPPPYADALKGM